MKFPFFRKEIVLVRIPIYHGVRIALGDVFNHLYGLVSLIGLVLSLFAVYFTYEHMRNNDSRYVIAILSSSLALLVIVFLLIIYMYSRKIQGLKVIERDYMSVDKSLVKYKLLNKYQSETLHNITHYKRNLDFRLNEALKKKYKGEELKPETIKTIKGRYDDFLLIVTSNLQNYFSFQTGDKCSVTIKKLDANKNYVRTLYRDPVSYNKRRKSDEAFNDKGGKYAIKDNTAFEVITDRRYTNTHWYDDNLLELKNSKGAADYKNCNSNWENLYNATIVVPISMILSDDKRDVLGFLTVDNFDGNLGSQENVEFMYSVADGLYNVFLKYEEFTIFAGQNR